MGWRLAAWWQACCLLARAVQRAAACRSAAAATAEQILIVATGIWRPAGLVQAGQRQPLALPAQLTSAFAVSAFAAGQQTQLLLAMVQPAQGAAVIAHHPAALP